MVYSDYVKQRILFYRHSAKSLQQIVRNLTEEGHVATKAGVAKLLRHYYRDGDDCAHTSKWSEVQDDSWGKVIDWRTFWMLASFFQALLWPPSFQSSNV